MPAHEHRHLKCMYPYEVTVWTLRGGFMWISAKVSSTFSMCSPMVDSILLTLLEGERAWDISDFQQVICSVV